MVKKGVGFPEVAKGAIALVVAILLTLFLGELVTRGVAHFTLIYNLEMVKYARELKISGAHLGVSHIHLPNAKARLMGVDVSLNSLGFRGPELSDQKIPGTKRVLVIGNSITLGWGVPESQVFTEVASRELGKNSKFKFEFVNAGIGNFNTEFENALFDLQRKKVNPDLILLQYALGDILPKPITKNNLLFKYSSLAAILYDRFSAVEFSFGAPKAALADFYEKFYFGDGARWKANQNFLVDMHAKALRDGVPMVVMIVPSSLNLKADSPFKKIYSEIERTLKEKNIPVINAFPVFQERFGGRERELWVQSDDSHPNALGHELMGKLLAQYLLAKTGSR